jgi:hypothetical protein
MYDVLVFVYAEFPFSTSLTVYNPGNAYDFEGFFNVEVVPSPKSHAYVVALYDPSVNCTGMFV